LTAYNSTAFTYDNNGNTTTKVNAEGTTTYTWDAENRLTTTVTPSKTVSFYCDPFGKRLSKTVDGVTTWYLYDAEDIVAEYDSTGTLLRSYIHGLGIDEPIRITIHDSPSTSYYYLADGLGSITEMQDSTGNSVEKYSYDSFGNVTIKDGAGNVLTESAIGNSYMFCGYWYDKETGLYYCRARYYDPQVGRFISADPIGFDGGINFYVYVLNNPIKYADPYGYDVYLKRGNNTGNPANDNVHRKVCVDVWAKCCSENDNSKNVKSRTRCFSYGSSHFVIIGEVYEDPYTGGVVLKTHSTNCKQDKEILLVLETMIGQHSIYNVGTNCVTWSNQTFKDISKSY
jgi:RHS repeat-associated protein